MTGPFTYHKATVENIQVVVDCRIEFLTGLLGNQSQESRDELEKELKLFLRRAIADNTYLCFFAMSGNAVAGIGGMAIREQPGNFKNPSGRVGYVMSMYTRPEFRKKGICTSILKMLLAEAGKIGITAFELHATKEGALVYEKNGFQIHSEPTYRKYRSKSSI